MFFLKLHEISYNCVHPQLLYVKILKYMLRWNILGNETQLQEKKGTFISL